MTSCCHRRYLDDEFPNMAYIIKAIILSDGGEDVTVLHPAPPRSTHQAHSWSIS